MACVSFAPDKRFRMDDTHRNFPHSDTKTTFWSTLAARRVATVLGKTRQPSVESQWGNYASSPPVGAVDCPSNSGGEVSLEPLPSPLYWKLDAEYAPQPRHLRRPDLDDDTRRKLLRVVGPFAWSGGR